MKEHSISIHWYCLMLAICHLLVICARSEEAGGANSGNVQTVLQDDRLEWPEYVWQVRDIVAGLGSNAYKDIEAVLLQAADSERMTVLKRIGHFPDCRMGQAIVNCYILAKNVAVQDECLSVMYSRWVNNEDEIYTVTNHAKLCERLYEDSRRLLQRVDGAWSSVGLQLLIKCHCVESEAAVRRGVETGRTEGEVGRSLLWMARLAPMDALAAIAGAKGVAMPGEINSNSVDVLRRRWIRKYQYEALAYSRNCESVELLLQEVKRGDAATRRECVMAFRHMSSDMLITYWDKIAEVLCDEELSIRSEVRRIARRAMMSRTNNELGHIMKPLYDKKVKEAIQKYGERAYSGWNSGQWSELSDE